MSTTSLDGAKRNSPGAVLFASLIGTTVEFFDFYIYATAAVLVFPTLFFPGTDPAAAQLSSFVTFAIAFFARPVGAVVFGHFGDRITTVAQLKDLIQRSQADEQQHTQRRDHKETLRITHRAVAAHGILPRHCQRDVDHHNDGSNRQPEQDQQLAAFTPRMVLLLKKIVHDDSDRNQNDTFTA